MNNYRYVYYSNGGIVLFGKDGYTQIELNRITRFLFGEGASLNQIFNCGGGGFIKFQYKPEVNKQRASLTTRVWRYCKKNKIKISDKNFKHRNDGGIKDADFDYFLKHINEHLEIHKS